MPFFGGFSPFPLRFGGGKTRVQAIYEALNESLGTAYDTSDTSNVTAETMAEARALAAVWSANRRLSLQWDPARMTDFVSRWEKIFDLHPATTDSMNDRRDALRAKFLALAGPSTVSDACAALLGDSFVGIETTPLASALIRWPANGYASEWRSSVAHILVRVQIASNQTLAEFIKLMGKLTLMLDDLLPAATTFDWATFADNGGDGFYLDEDHNLNFESFDS